MASGRHVRQSPWARSIRAAVLVALLASLVASATLTGGRTGGGRPERAGAAAQPMSEPTPAQVTPVPSGTSSASPSPSAHRSATPSTHPAPPGAARAVNARAAAVRRAVAAAAASAVAHGVSVDVAVRQVAPLRSATVVAVPSGADEHPTRTASIVKLLVLRAVAARGTPSSTTRALARAMITRSDNDATKRLWRAAGGNTAIAAQVAELGMTRTRRIPALARRWDGWRTTADDQVRLLTRLQTGTDAGSRWARALMGDVVCAQAWGVGAVPGALGVKNGWLPVNGRWIINSDGCVRSHGMLLCLSVLTRGNHTMGAGTAVVKAVAEAAVKAWTAKR
jgi:hypothetical protein